MQKTKVTLYIPDKMELFIANNNYKDLTADDIDIVEQGCVVFNHSFNKTGVYDKNGVLQKSSVLLRYSEHDIENINKHIKKFDFMDEDVIYLGTGYMFQHFGHFLIEGISRFWPLLYPKYKNTRVVIALHGKQDIPAFVRKALNAMGVCDKNIIVINKNTKFTKVFIPHQSTNIGIKVLPITKSVYDKIAENMYDKNIDVFDKIYLSRSAMNDGRTFGEKQIEKIFEKNGYKIIHPEQIPLEHQITLAHSCKEMAGTSGSALHLAAFMKPGGRVIQIKRNSDSSDNIHIQKMINSISGIDTILVYGSIEKYITHHFTSAPQIVGITPEMLRFFNDFHFKYDESDIAFDTDEFARYERQLQKYKIHKTYSNIMRIPIKIISTFGITKHGREILRESLRKTFHC